MALIVILLIIFEGKQKKIDRF